MNNINAYSNMNFYVNTIMNLTKTNGMSVTDFNLSGKNINNNDFLGFIDKLKEFTKKSMEDKTSVNFAKSYFSEELKSHCSYCNGFYYS